MYTRKIYTEQINLPRARDIKETKEFFDRYIFQHNQAACIFYKYMNYMMQEYLFRVSRAIYIEKMLIKGT